MGVCSVPSRMPAVVLRSPPSFGFDPLAADDVARLTNPGPHEVPTRGDVPLPKDPRQWSREDVARWLQHMSTVHSLPPIQFDRFLMNGKALCLMTIDMFVQRVPLGGKLLYKDFQLRLCAAMYSR